MEERLGEVQVKGIETVGDVDGEQKLNHGHEHQRGHDAFHAPEIIDGYGDDEGAYDVIEGD